VCLCVCGTLRTSVWIMVAQLSIVQGLTGLQPADPHNKYREKGILLAFTFHQEESLLDLGTVVTEEELDAA